MTLEILAVISDLIFPANHLNGENIQPSQPNHLANMDKTKLKYNQEQH